ncbi:UV radiation resistance associated protein, partial [Gryllus bimaculatus]
KWIEMLGQFHEMLAPQRVSPRWKEWIPLVSQQLRLRNLIQVIAYNVNVPEKVKCDAKIKLSRTEKTKSSFYYTLHLTTMSAPFYTSEKLETENPKWAEIDIGETVNAINASVNGIVVRLWVHRNTEQDQVLTVWGVYFSGLIYLGPKLCTDPAAFCLNTIVFHMHGGYFTAPQCFKEPAPRIRHAQVKISVPDVQPSYTVSLVSRLHTIQQAIKKQRSAAQVLREKISVGRYTPPESRESATLRRLLNKSRPQAPQRQEVQKIKREIEMTKFRVEMLAQERSRKIAELQALEKSKALLSEINQDRGTELLDNYRTLQKEMERLKDKRKTYIDTRDAYLMTNAQLIFRQKQLISKLSQIYPVTQLSDGKYSICGVHLPNSEDFAGNDEIMISVSLGYVSHVLQMISVFLQVPLRYPIIHFGSWSKIVDHVVEKIPEKDREFPLFSRGKDKLQFNYGVYLLNKNVSQLRWYCGLPTQDLRATLPNLSGLLRIHPTTVPEFHYQHHHHHHHTSSGSSLDLRSSSQNQSPIGSVPPEFRKDLCEKDAANSFEKGHRISRSMDSSDMNFQSKINEPDVQSAKEFKILKERTDLVNGSPSVSTSLSYSLDKGLDEYEELKKAELPSKPPLSSKPQAAGGRALASVGSEPILTQEMRERVHRKDDLETVSSGDEAKKHFLQSWQAGGPAPVCSDDEGLPHSQLPHNCLYPQSPELLAEKLEGHCVTENGANSDLCSDQTQEPQLTDVHGIVQEQVPFEDECPFYIPEDHVTHQKIYNHSNKELPVDNHITEKKDEPTKERGNAESTLTNHSDCDSKRRKSECIVESENGSENPHLTSKSLQNVNNRMLDTTIPNRKDLFDEAVSLEEMSSLIDSSVLVDSVFASVASRTEALANRSGTFNLVRSRHSSMLEDGNS